MPTNWISTVGRGTPKITGPRAVRTAIAVAGRAAASALLATASAVFIALTETEKLFLLESLSVVFAYAFVLALILSATFGLIWHLFAVRTGLVNAGYYALAGGVIGAFVSGAIAHAMIGLGGAGAPPGYDFSSEHNFSVLFGAMMGAFSALAAWFIRRPDRDAIPPTNRSAADGA